MGASILIGAPGASPGMRTVEVSRRLPVAESAIEASLTPETVADCDAALQPVGVEPREDGTTVVSAITRGVQARFVFEPHPDGLRYLQEGDRGPFAVLETEWTHQPDGDGSHDDNQGRVVARSTIARGFPLATLTDRVAAWRRRRELERSLDGFVEQLS